MEEQQGKNERDLLKMFTSDVQKFNVLTREEEDILLRGFEEEKPAIINRLIEANLRLALQIVFRYWTPGDPLLDMVSGACLGIVTAGKGFKPGFGVRFTTYAFSAIRQGVLRAKFNRDLAFCESLDAPIYENGDCRKDRLTSEESSPEDKAETRDLTGYLRVLTLKERRVIELRFWDDMTLEGVGEILGIQKESVRNIESKALMKLRFALREIDVKWH